MQKPHCCFLHLPKSGGSALTRHLRSVLPKPAVFHAWSFQLDEPLTSLLARFRVVAGHFSFAQLADAPASTTFLFTFLREPVDRVLSLYYFLRKEEIGPGGDPYGDLSRAQAHSLPELLAGLPVPLRPSAWSNNQTYLLSGAQDSERPAEELLPAALRNLESLDFVGVHEDYDACVRKLGELRGWPLNEAPPRFKVTAGRPSMAELDPALLAEVARFNECDAQLYARARELWADTRERSAAESPTAG